MGKNRQDQKEWHALQKDRGEEEEEEDELSLVQFPRNYLERHRGGDELNKPGEGLLITQLC